MSFFKLFANCIPVKGYKFSIICDLQRHKYNYIPNEIYDILTKDLDLEINELKEKYPKNFPTILDYFNFFSDEELGFFTDEPDHFPQLSTNFETPNLIDNSIIDISKTSNHNFSSIFNQLSELGCFFLELRYFDAQDLGTIDETLKKSYGLRFKNISLYIRYSKELSIAGLKKLIKKHSSVGSIIVHSSPTDNNYLFNGQSITFIKQEVNSANCCGNISTSYFSINISSYTEALSFNTCLNKKISIDVHGNIKNCPSMENSFGTIESESLFSVIKKTKFKKLWAVNKDQINGCKDCQFRYICTDCRAFVENVYDKPKKCNYDPYTHTWK
jgi:SPASM domain peptide maturase of grasp-with-spasm system